LPSLAAFSAFCLSTDSFNLASTTAFSAASLASAAFFASPNTFEAASAASPDDAGVVLGYVL